MARKVKLGKVAIVVFLTTLIWIWADLALDETLPDIPAEVTIDESANPELWASFNQSPSTNIKIELSGPHTAISNEAKRLREGKIREFVLNIAQESMNQPRNYDWRLLPFLQKDKQLKQLGLKVDSCEPQLLNVNVVELVNKQLTVECFDENGMSLKPESIEPAKVVMFVPEGRRTAQVRLTRREIEQARSIAIERKPYVELSEGQLRYAAEPVRIKMPPEANPLSEAPIKVSKLGIALSPNLQGKYKVEIKNLPQVIGQISIRATQAAKQAYEGMRYQVILEIDDEDIKSEEVRRELVYNFPEEFVSKDEIRLNQPLVQAIFKLVPLSTEVE
jgi:hypothetical protein